MLRLQLVTSPPPPTTRLLAAGILVALAVCGCADGRPRSWLPPRPAVYAPAPAGPPFLLHNSVVYRIDDDGFDDEDPPLDVAQFHSQDSAGRVFFGFNTPDQSRVESRSLDGSVRGSYSYQDPTGQTVQVRYWDEGDGFHVSGLPYPSYTPEVEAARRHHFQLFREALMRTPSHSAGGDETEEGVESFQPEEEKQSEDRVMEGDKVGEAGSEGEEERPSSDYEEDSGDSVAVESAAYSNIRAAPAPGRKEPEANRKQVAQVTNLMLDDLSGGGLALARIGPDGFQYLVPVADPVTGLSESRHATLYGAVPVDAVHDAQVSPNQRAMAVDSHQLKPLLLRTA